jgi:voltage-gated potassium channel
MKIGSSMRPPEGDSVSWTRFRAGMGVLGLVLVLGTVGYILLGLPWLDALYQTVITISTVGYRELGTFGTRYQVFTILLILFGTGTALYTLGVLIDTMFEARITGHFRRRRMKRGIDRLKGHVILCGYGQVGEAICEEITRSGRQVVIVDRSLRDRVDGSFEMPVVQGDATDDAVLARAGLDRAATLVLALDSDVDNLYVALTARSINPEIFIVARANHRAAIAKLQQAGADRVVNPHQIGGAHMAAVVAQPEVVDFLDVVMQDGRFEVRMAHFEIAAGSQLAGRALGEAGIRRRTGSTILAIRRDETFLTNPDGQFVLEPGDIIIALGTEDHLRQLQTHATGT